MILTEEELNTNDALRVLKISGIKPEVLATVVSEGLSDLIARALS
jgi:hypothetical protein